MTLAFGALLIPGSAAAQTVRPTTPGSSAFTANPASAEAEAAAAAAAGARAEAAGSGAPGASGAAGRSAKPSKLWAVGLVQIGAPIAYQPPSSVSSQDAVAVAGNLTPSTAPTSAAAPPPTREPAPAAEPAPAPEPPAWYAPAPGAPITNPYGVANAEYAAGYHTGVDFAVDLGTPLHAVGDATVVSAGYAGAYGKEVVLRLPDDHYAEYAHMSFISVSAGDRVAAGQEIGQSGSTGNSTGPHLHFEIRTSNHYGAVVDPIGYLTEHGATDF